MSKFDSSSVVIPSSLLDRFLRYVKIDTQSDEESTLTPSTTKQYDLLNLLKKEDHKGGEKLGLLFFFCNLITVW